MSMTATFRIVIAIIGVGIVVGALVLSMGVGRQGRVTTDMDPTIAREGHATMQNGIQYVDIEARAGYSPRVTKAIQGVETIIRMKTKGTYDCSSALVIPSLGYQTSLQPTGIVEIPVPLEKAQGTLEGLCSMGMYRFSIVFE